MDGTNVAFLNVSPIRGSASQADTRGKERLNSSIKQKKTNDSNKKGLRVIGI
ncbi:hypothetical protein [Desulfosporosinus sp. FKA]|uniref:hypothetical protein n=1 Tax=Desulfosporosinus sp. FKA TaxID=1969834 RepID=UPI0015562775|nr:hypothetical protein [Desulfosporosinus sp. FKA]